MARTTLNIDTPLLEEIKRMQRESGKPLGKLVSELLGEALGGRQTPAAGRQLAWSTQDMGATVDIADKEALHAALDRDRR